MGVVIKFLVLDLFTDLSGRKEWISSYLIELFLSSFSQLSPFPETVNSRGTAVITIACDSELDTTPGRNDGFPAKNNCVTSDSE